jgi:hypothetical protein
VKQKWEYMVELIQLDSAEGIRSAVHVAGMSGWELVTVVPESSKREGPAHFNRGAFAIYKRRGDAEEHKPSP